MTTTRKLFLCLCLGWTCMGGFDFCVSAQALGNSNQKLALEIPLQNTTGSIIGRAHLSQTAEGVKIRVQAAGLSPGLHGIHFHEKGSCVGPDFTSAGAHFNPFGKQHGLANPLGYHSGDLPNLVVNSEGQANMEMVSKAITLQRDQPGSLIRPEGLSLIIHEQEDDLRTDPTGNSGNRVACGVVK
ncbi:superoxide dismutase family protein [Paenibacillus sp. GP183]|uniref:superoxide dismutase family protein n=1 Tax=Paenibacillus sp. GP183 TaxID=1882751 RepID=UPI000899F13C|nr:superoxide dismutase family protein [Paenibacillus sp. GP183]SEB43195.1 superoxide dismutase, Cu-Zn family [Paenibacillus sp. GP183]